MGKRAKKERTDGDLVLRKKKKRRRRKKCFGARCEKESNKSGVRAQAYLDSAAMLG